MTKIKKGRRRIRKQRRRQQTGVASAGFAVPSYGFAISQRRSNAVPFNTSDNATRPQPTQADFMVWDAS